MLIFCRETEHDEQGESAEARDEHNQHEPRTQAGVAEATHRDGEAGHDHSQSDNRAEDRGDKSARHTGNGHQKQHKACEAYRRNNHRYIAEPELLSRSHAREISVRPQEAVYKIVLKETLRLIFFDFRLIFFDFRLRFFGLRLRIRLIRRGLGLIDRLRLRSRSLRLLRLKRLRLKRLRRRLGLSGALNRLLRLFEPFAAEAAFLGRCGDFLTAIRAFSSFHYYIYD